MNLLFISLKTGNTTLSKGYEVVNPTKTTTKRKVNMSIVHLNAWRPLDGLPEQMNNWLNDSFWGKQNSVRWRPALDIKENAESYVIHMDVPGVKNEDIEVTLDDGYLRISGSRNLERNSDDEDGSYRSFERVSGSFQRAVRLPSHSTSDHVSAAVKDGVLTITIAKPEEVLPKRIEVMA